MTENRNVLYGTAYWITTTYVSYFINNIPAHLLFYLSLCNTLQLLMLLSLLVFNRREWLRTLFGVVFLLSSYFISYNILPSQGLKVFSIINSLIVLLLLNTLRK